MTTCFLIAPVDRVGPDLRALANAATDEGFPFMDRLIDKWVDGRNRFDRQGEAYFEVRQEGRLVAAGGLNRDPYCSEPDVGRVRHVYVLPDARRSGAGTALMARIIGTARSDFTVLRLRTTTAHGAAFYEALGFERSDAPDASHTMLL